MEKLIKPQNELTSDFKKFNLVLMIVLSFFTLGAYIGIWFIRNKNSIENLRAKKTIHFGIWKMLTMIAFVFLFIRFFGEMILSDYGIANLRSYEVIFNFFFVGVLYYSIFRLRDAFEDEYGIELNKYYLFFFHIFFIQFKINQMQAFSQKLVRG